MRNIKQKKTSMANIKCNLKHRNLKVQDKCVIDISCGNQFEKKNDISYMM